MQIRFNKKKTFTSLGRKYRIKKKRPYKKTTKKKIFLISSEPFLFLIFCLHSLLVSLYLHITLFRTHIEFFLTGVRLPITLMSLSGNKNGVYARGRLSRNKDSVFLDSRFLWTFFLTVFLKRPESAKNKKTQ